MRAMIHFRIKAGLLALGIVLFPLLAEALVLKLSLSEMVKRADDVVVGTVVGLSPVGGAQSGQISHRALVRVVEQLKGTHQEEIVISLIGDSGLEAVLREGNTYVLFLENVANKRMIVQGYAGAVLLRDGVALGIRLDDEGESQPKDEFVRKVQRAVADPSRSKY